MRPETLIVEPGLQDGQNVLYCGTGSGFGTYAVSSLVGEGTVESYEVSEYAYKEARKRLERLGLRNTKVYHQDVFEASLPEEGFDRALVMAGAPYQQGTKDLSVGEKVKIAPNGAAKFFCEKLKPDGKMLMPMGVLHCYWGVVCEGGYFMLSKEKDGMTAEKIGENSTWAPLVGKFGFSDEEINKCRWTEGSFADDML